MSLKFGPGTTERNLRKTPKDFFRKHDTGNNLENAILLNAILELFADILWYVFHK